jgi:glycosyltransferase involved in cell wall biosynthesis
MLKIPRNPLVSVVTPSYNQAEFLEDTIRSVLRQNYPNIEYIIIDGGSTDGSIDIIKKYIGKIAHWVSESDKGQADAINKGFSMARGDIVAWLNSDDMYFPGAVERAVERFRKIPSLGCLYGDAVFVSRQGNFLRYFTEVEPFDEFRLRNCLDFIMQPTTFFLRKAFLDLGGLDTSLHYTMDYDLWCRLARGGYNFHYGADLVAANREHADAKTVSGDFQRLHEILKVLRRHKSTLWPHAGLSYTRTLLLSLLARSNIPGKRALLIPVSWGLGAACWRNFLYSRRHSKSIGGIQPHSSVMQKKAQLCLPVYREARGILLSLEVPFKLRGGRSQTVRISVNDEDYGTFDFKGDTFSQDIVLHCGESINSRNVAEVDLEFEHVRKQKLGRYRVAALLKGMSLLYEKEASP